MMSGHKISAILVLISILLSAGSPAGGITIKGSEPGYAGRSLKFLTYTDPVSLNEKEIFKLLIDAKGNFGTEIQVRETTFCYCDFGIYRGKLLLVPSENIILKLPPLREKSFEESKNPYFEPVEIWLQVNEGTEKTLTTLVSRFDSRFFYLTDHYFNQLYYRNLSQYRDTIRNILDQEFSRYTNPYLQMHRQIRIKSVEADMARAGREKTIGFLKELSVKDWDQPAFREFLNTLFVSTLSNESKTIGGSRLKQWVRDKNIPELKKWCGKFCGVSTPMDDLILLKMLHDAFYSGEFSKTTILEILRSDYFARQANIRIIQIDKELIAKLTFLEKGSPAPEICLPQPDGKNWCTGSNTKPYLYLMFADLEIPICREQVKYLKTMVEKTGPNLQVVLVVSPSGKINISDFISRNQVPGIILIENRDNENAGKYKVRSFPSAYLLDKNQKVVLAPAKTPLDGFEFQFAGL
jgi:peroxiredoxin